MYQMCVHNNSLSTRLLESIFSTISDGNFPVLHPTVSFRVKVTLKFLLLDIKFLGINFLHFSTPTFITIKTAAELCKNTTNIILRARFTLNQISNQSGTTVQNPFTNVKCFTFILV